MRTLVSSRCLDFVPSSVQLCIGLGVSDQQLFLGVFGAHRPTESPSSPEFSSTNHPSLASIGIVQDHMSWHQRPSR